MKVNVDGFWLPRASSTLAPDLERLERLDEREFSNTFRESPIKRSRLAGFLRNVRLARQNEQAHAHPSATRNT